MTVVPNVRGVTIFLSTDATAGLDDANVQPPGDVDVGATRLRLATLSFMIVMSPKVPNTGAITCTVNLMDTNAALQFGVLA